MRLGGNNLKRSKTRQRKSKGDLPEDKEAIKGAKERRTNREDQEEEEKVSIPQMCQEKKKREKSISKEVSTKFG